MAGRPKQGIDYSGWSVDMFDSDKKIDKLLDAQGGKDSEYISFSARGHIRQMDISTNGVMTIVQRLQGRWAAALIPG